MVLSVQFFEGSNVAECLTFEINLFTLTVHNMFICYAVSHISFVKGNSVLIYFFLDISYLLLS